MNSVTLSNIKNLIEADINELTKAWDHEKLMLQRQIEELKSYTGVSMVRSMANEISNLTAENAILKKKLSYSTTDSYKPKHMKEDKQEEKQRQEEKEKQRQEKKEKEQEKEKEKQRQEEKEQEKEKQRQEEKEQEKEKERQEEEKEKEQERQEEEKEKEQERQEEEQEKEQEKQEENQEPEQREPESQEDQVASEGELVALDLESGSYFWDRETGDLYEVISESECGRIINKLKSVTISGKIHYIDERDSTIYSCVPETLDVGERVGYIKDRRAVFY